MLLDVALPPLQGGVHACPGVVEARPGVILGGHDLGRRPHGVVAGGDLAEDVPGDRHTDGRTRQGARAVGAGQGAVATGLVEVGEDPLAPQLLPPGRGDQVGDPPLELAGDRDDRVPHLEELVRRLDRCEHVQPAVAARLDEGSEARLDHHLAEHGRRLHGLREAGAGLRVEVDAQLVRVVGVRRGHGPGVEGHGVHLHGPHGGRDLVDDELRVLAAGGIGAHDGAGEVGDAAGRVLGVELLAGDALGEALQRHRTVRQPGHQPVPHGHDVAGQVLLGDAVVRPHHPVRARDPHLPRLAVRPRDLDRDGLARHDVLLSARLSGICGDPARLDPV